MLLLLFGWLGYFALHSVLATTWLKARVAERWPRLSRLYRLSYNVIAVGLFVLLMRYQRQLPAYTSWGDWLPLRVLGYLLLLSGTVLVLVALRGYNLAEFGGWGYLRSGGVPTSTTLNISGLNNRMRHPLYSGMLLVLAGYVLIQPVLPRLVFAACAALYILVGARLEERKLLTHFGEAYARYQKRVPMLLPGRRNAQPD